jgi:hypothetical protein
LIIGPASREGTPIRFKVESGWHEMRPFPSQMRPALVAELGRMARFPEGAFPKEGSLSVEFWNVLLKWRVRITDAEGDCEFTRVAN